MIGNAHKQIRTLVGSTIAALVLFSAVAFALQEKPSPLSDFQYKKDYAQYETISKEADPVKRADALLAFLKEHPVSKMLPYVAGAYQACVAPHIGKDPAKVIAMEEALAAVLPAEKTVMDDANIPVGKEDFIKQLQAAQLAIQQTLLTAYYQGNNLPKAAETAEKVYATTQDKTVLFALADIYGKLKNSEKFLSYGQKIMTEFPLEQSYTIALQMAQSYLEKQDMTAAIDLLTKLMDAFGEKTPPNVQEAQWNATKAFAYGVIASGIYAKKDYPKALELYAKVAQLDPKRDDAYYFIGMCKWQGKDAEGAMEPFAKSVVLNKQYAQRAKTYLEQIYKGRNKDSLEGLDNILAKAKADLGL